MKDSKDDKVCTILVADLKTAAEMEEEGAQKQERKVKGNGDLSFSHTIKPLLLFGGRGGRSAGTLVLLRVQRDNLNNPKKPENWVAKTSYQPVSSAPPFSPLTLNFLSIFP